MKQCPVCGLTVEDREPFCPRCSADLTHVPPQPARRPFTWADVATFLGFCASIVGYFGASVLFFPLAILASVLGFKGDRARGLAVAGIVIATLGLLLKLMFILRQAEFLPQWFTSGVW